MGHSKSHCFTGFSVRSLVFCTYQSHVVAFNTIYVFLTSKLPVCVWDLPSIPGSFMHLPIWYIHLDISLGMRFIEHSKTELLISPSTIPALPKHFAVLINKFTSQKREEITAPKSLNRQKEIRFTVQVQVFIFAGRNVSSQWPKRKQDVWAQAQVMVVGVCGYDLLSHSLKCAASSSAETLCRRRVEHCTKITSSSRTNCWTTYAVMGHLFSKWEVDQPWLLVTWDIFINFTKDKNLAMFVFGMVLSTNI